MHTITNWARAHRWAARTIIVLVIYPLLNISGWFLGVVLAFNDVLVDQSWLYPISIFFLILFVVYPYRFDKKYRNYFLWKRSTDALMILATFCFIVVRGNGINSETGGNGIVTGSYASGKTVTNNSGSTVVSKEKHPIKKLIKSRRKKYKDADSSTKTVYIILAVLGAILLLFALLLLTCSIACSGAEALAYTVFLLGLVGIIILLSRVIRRIKNGPRKKKAAASPPPD